MQLLMLPKSGNQCMQVAFQIKGSLFTLTTLSLNEADLDTIENQLSNKVRQAPQFFKNTPIIIDVTQIEDMIEVMHLDQLVEIVTKHELIAIGFRSKKTKFRDYLTQKGIALFKDNRQPTNRPAQRTQAQNSSSNTTATDRNETLIIESRVRSGQQMVAEQGDLIVLNSVSSGAEVVAKKNIHIYGTLSGRAFAGANGDKNARIFCKNLDADLVSIAGQYIILEEIPRGEQFANGYQITLEDGKISIKPICH